MELYLHDEHWKIMLADVLERNSEEACGIVAGIDGTSCAVFPVTNVLHSPVRFLMDPEEQLNVFNKIEDQDWQMVAIYHSHLQGPKSPSQTDINEAYYPEVINLIWSNTTGDWICRGFWIVKGQVKSVPVVRLKG
jgi:proteasome lid subunit RPN8/RPN11